MPAKMCIRDRLDMGEKAVVSSIVAENMGLNVGDVVRVYTTMPTTGSRVERPTGQIRTETRPRLLRLSLIHIFAKGVREYIEAGKDQQGKGIDPRKLLKPGRDNIVARTKELMEEFGSVNKA